MLSGLETFLSIGVLATILIFVLAMWSIVWKGFALWFAAREKKTYWFIVILILNTAGILEIIYMVFFSESGKKYISGWKKHRALKKEQKKSHSK